MRTEVLVIGGGATGIGILRDLAMRGIDALLIEQGVIVHGTSSRYHGLLHSGARYAVKDIEAARECIEENRILRRIGRSCVEETTGYFLQVEGDDPAFVDLWTEGCTKSGIPFTEIDPAAALLEEPNLAKDLTRVFEVPDAAIDGFRMAWQVLESACRYGANFLTYTKLDSFIIKSGTIKGVKVINTLDGTKKTISCDYVVNATGPWAGEVTRLAGLDCTVSPSKGTMICFNKRIVSRIINKLRPPGNGDIFVPHGPITILGTSSLPVESPEDTSSSWEEIEELLKVGETVIDNLRRFRVLRVFAGSRPLYVPKGTSGGRNATRGFHIIDHEEEGLTGLLTITGGKLSTFRLMAERFTDILELKIKGFNTPCRTADEPFVPEVEAEAKDKARHLFPSYGVNLAATRLGVEKFQQVVELMEDDSSLCKVICECENVTLAELKLIAEEETSHSLDDLRRRTRMGMGSCQANYCTLRAAAAVKKYLGITTPTLEVMKTFLKGRFKGIHKVLSGNTLRAAEMTRGMYQLLFNVNGAKPKP